MLLVITDPAATVAAFTLLVRMDPQLVGVLCREKRVALLMNTEL
jgi:hypothetical protein